MSCDKQCVEAGGDGGEYIHVTQSTLDACQKQASRAGTSNYIPQILWDVITCPYPWYLLLPLTSSYIELDFCTIQRRQNPPQIILKFTKVYYIQIVSHMIFRSHHRLVIPHRYRRFVRYWDYCETYWAHHYDVEFNIPFVAEILCRDDFVIIMIIIWKLYQCPESQCYANVRKFKVQKAGTGEFPAQMASKAENVSIWWRHHEISRARTNNNIPQYLWDVITCP